MSVPVLPDGTFTITPNDNTDLPKMANGILILTAGTISYVGADGSADSISATIPAFTVLPVRIRKVLATGTTATMKGFNS